MFSWRSAMLWFVLSQLAGCAGESSGAIRADVSNVEIGMTQNQVFSILGQPQMREAYGPTEFLFYTSSYGASIPIAVVDGKVKCTRLRSGGTSIGTIRSSILMRLWTCAAFVA